MAGIPDPRYYPRPVQVVTQVPSRLQGQWLEEWREVPAWNSVCRETRLYVSRRNGARLMFWAGWWFGRRRHLKIWSVPFARLEEALIYVCWRADNDPQWNRRVQWRRKLRQTEGELSGDPAPVVLLGPEPRGGAEYPLPGEASMAGGPPPPLRGE